MLLTVLKYAFELNSLLLALSIIGGKCFVFNKKDAMFISNYCAGIAVFMGLYVLMSFVFAGIAAGGLSKSVMAFFGISPFILGLSANYNNEKYFTAAQVIFIIISILYVMRFLS